MPTNESFVSYRENPGKLYRGNKTDFTGAGALSKRSTKALGQGKDQQSANIERYPVNLSIRDQAKRWNLVTYDSVRTKDFGTVAKGVV